MVKLIKTHYEVLSLCFEQTTDLNEDQFKKIVACLEDKEKLHWKSISSFPLLATVNSNRPNKIFLSNLAEKVANAVSLDFEATGSIVCFA